MSSTFDSDPVMLHYSKWIYPAPIMDLSDPKILDSWDSGDPSRLGLAYWPNLSNYKDDISILVAGCGTNAAARYAFRNRKASVIGIDISSKSLDHEKYLMEKHDLKNLVLYQVRIEDVESLKKEFDFIDCSGVLHHLSDPVLGLKALRNVLTKNGVVYLMLYGKYGRAGIYLFQELFRLMGLEQDSDGLMMAKEALRLVKDEHPVKLVTLNNDDLKYDAGLVDVFLHKRDKSFSVDGCLDVVRDSGLVFQGWDDNLPYYPEGHISCDSPLFKYLQNLSDVDIWRAMELFNGNIAKHCFYVCRSDREYSSYQIKFDDCCFLDYVPVCRKPSLSIPMNSYQLEVFKFVDGTNSIRQCLDKSMIHGKSDEVIEFALCVNNSWTLSPI
ncbi:MAG: class I SAM-dependent methyltransferase [Planctomycetes bacterium]|nr:class I SAM-dependent methyltransferase [Planctomycetota bacterium]